MGGRSVNSGNPYESRVSAFYVDSFLRNQWLCRFLFNFFTIITLVNKVPTFIIQDHKLADQKFEYHPEIMKIIQEEAESFLAGYKTAKEVAEVIQNRVELYLKE